jgi:predicted glycogen debranching enzyme
VWGGTADLPAINATGAFGARKRYETLVLRAAPPVLGEVGQLVLAADQFIVDRRSAAVPDGKTVIAGYHWFGDWGRDTAIALPGLAIATGRRDVARSILQTFARFVDRGMLPNVFPDRGDVPEYNTVDAALWYVEAVRAYVAAYGKDPSFETMYAACAAIVEGYRSGTRYRIAMDASDALIFAGEPGVQLTWMDAKVGNWVVTPRIGKPVEINALWYNALGILGDLSRLRGNDGSRYDALGARVRESFSRYVLPAGRGLYDVLDGPEGDDPSLRPNQIFAVALQYMPLDEPVARDVVDVCLRELVTSHGLRTLAPSDPRYAGAYGGSREARDGAYHQGTVWPWLLGPFACAHARIYGDRSAARSFLAPLLESLGAYGLGTLAEIGDGDAPFAWKGTIAQAWSVGETLRAISALEG